MNDHQSGVVLLAVVLVGLLLLAAVGNARQPRHECRRSVTVEIGRPCVPPRCPPPYHPPYHPWHW